MAAKFDEKDYFSINFTDEKKKGKPTKIGNNLEELRNSEDEEMVHVC